MLGVVFAIGGSIALKARSVRPFVIVTVATAILGVAIGLWQDHRNNDPDIGFTILLFLLSPIITGASLAAISTTDSQLGKAGLILTIPLGLVAWAIAYAIAGFIGIALNLVTF